MRTTVPLLLVLLTVALHYAAAKEIEYTNEWVVTINGDEQQARDIAATHGFAFLQKVGNHDRKYHFLHAGESRRSKRTADDLTELLESHPMVVSAVQQELKVRVKRSNKELEQMILDRMRKIEIIRKKLEAAEVEDLTEDTADGTPGKTQKTVIPHVDVLSPDFTGDDFNMPFNDPLYPKQWYLHSTGQGGAAAGMDLNLVPAWKLGYTGKGVKVTIVDDGVDGTHPDLDDNFDLKASFDFNNITDPYSTSPTQENGDLDPHPDDNPVLMGENDHGTKCAGEVAAEANNEICGVGVAYGVSLGGIRLLDGPITDALESSALSYNYQYVDIYNCCWGPQDDGETFEGPSEMTAETLKDGAMKGRGGLGSIFVWASGNGGLTDDDCAADGYVSSIYTIAIGAITGQGHSAFFIESCSPVMAVTLVGSTHNPPEGALTMSAENWVVTTDLNHECTEHFTGTSSAAPFASGSFAVVLEANPNLTWRDLQHIVTRGCNIPNPTQEGWYINGAGFHLNHKFGFGLLDVSKMVELALTWEKVGPQLTCEAPRKKFNIEVARGDSTNITMQVDACSVVYLEHTQAHISFESPRRGDISLFLYSPSGTISSLLSTRKWDEDDKGVTDWPFMTVHNWGENPIGEWTLEVRYVPDPEIQMYMPPIKPETMPRGQKQPKAKLTEWGLTFYGTKDPVRPESDADAGGKSGEKSDEDSKQTSTPLDNTAVHPEDAEKGDPDTIANIYNGEQASNEEIVIELQNLAAGVNLPPNMDNNIVGDEINTDEGFNGVVIDADGNEIPYNDDVGPDSRLNNHDFYKGDPDPLFNEALDPKLRELIIKTILARRNSFASRDESSRYSVKDGYYNHNTQPEEYTNEDQVIRRAKEEIMALKILQQRKEFEAKKRRLEKEKLIRDYLNSRD
ncbi:neuroendocrine convertase 2-like [Ptychodera flava]|uniref:neuroendocrine convertase 2-like n=1 Tax=Ptychodera flava TaxID=63121 RepID=UPI00396A6145